jgi:hypothetical protein
MRPSGAKRTHNSLSRFSTLKFGNLRRDTNPPNFLDHGIIVKMVRTQVLSLLDGMVPEGEIGWPDTI